MNRKQFLLTLFSPILVALGFKQNKSLILTKNVYGVSGTTGLIFAMKNRHDIQIGNEALFL